MLVVVVVVVVVERDLGSGDDGDRCEGARNQETAVALLIVPRPDVSATQNQPVLRLWKH